MNASLRQRKGCQAITFTKYVLETAIWMNEETNATVINSPYKACKQILPTVLKCDNVSHG